MPYSDIKAKTVKVGTDVRSDVLIRKKYGPTKSNNFLTMITGQNPNWKSR